MLAFIHCLFYREIARIAGCSQGAAACELREWKKEQESGVATTFLEDIPPISEDLISKPENEVEELAPLEIVRF